MYESNGKDADYLTGSSAWFDVSDVEIYVVTKQ